MEGTVNFVTGGGRGHYHGLDNVKYDGYHASLHKSEMVLPREEAKAYREGRAGGSGQPFSINIACLLG